MSVRNSFPNLTLACCLGAVGAALLGGAPAPAVAAPHISEYQLTEAQLKVTEDDSYTSDSKVAWTAKATRTETLASQGDELPPLPLPFPPSGGGVVAQTEQVDKGKETLIDYEGQEDPCSGDWEKKGTAGLVVLLKPGKPGKLTTNWEIPHGFASPCGFSYDQMPDRLHGKATVKGRIGDPELTLPIKGAEEKSHKTGHGKIEQKVEWEGRVVLTLLK